MSDLQSRLVGMRSTLGLGWTPDYRQQMFDTISEAENRIAELEAALKDIYEELAANSDDVPTDLLEKLRDMIGPHLPNSDKW